MVTNALHNLINKLAKLVEQKDAANAVVSSANVGWHLQHMLLVIDKVITQMQVSNSIEYRPKMGFFKIIVLTFGKIPRGKRKAPKAVTPQQQLSEVQLFQLFDVVKQKVDEMPQLQPNQFFDHPLFGHLNTKTAVKFLLIHSNHHLKIINDILAK